MDEINFDEIQQVINEVLGGGLDFQQMVQQGVEGKSPFAWKNLVLFFQRIFFEELIHQKQMWIHILILAIAAAVLIHFAEVFQNRSVSQISFCIIYMLLVDYCIQNY